MGLGERASRSAGSLVRYRSIPNAGRRLTPCEIRKFTPPLAEALAARGYDTLTSVQSAVIEEEAEGRDLIVSAKTGSGKTVAFGLAIADQLIEGGPRTLDAASRSDW